MNSKSQIIFYQTEDNKTKIEVHLENETVWLNQAQMAELFQKSVKTVSEHIRNIYKENELEREATIWKFQTVQDEGTRQVTREIEYYNLDVIISVGYRVKSHRGTQFRIWATQRLREYLVKGFVINDERLAGNQSNYFDELIERVRRIRTSEANFYQKVRDIFATSIDYNPKTEFAKEFFSTVQNKFHYAIHGKTAAELIASRVSSEKPMMGLSNWRGEVVTSADAKIAKNYLGELELKRLELLVEQFLSFAELRSVEQKPMYMQDWLSKLDGFLQLNDMERLQGKGLVSRQDMEEKVRAELAKYRANLGSSSSILQRPPENE